MTYAWGNAEAVVLSLLALVWYNAIYTPLKNTTAYAVVPGSFVGSVTIKNRHDSEHGTGDITEAVPNDVDYELILSQITRINPTAASLGDLKSSSVIAVPASWTSAWAFEDVILESGTNYCFESMNSVDYGAETLKAKTVAAARRPKRARLPRVKRGRWTNTPEATAGASADPARIVKGRIRGLPRNGRFARSSAVPRSCSPGASVGCSSGGPRRCATRATRPPRPPPCRRSRRPRCPRARSALPSPACR